MRLNQTSRTCFELVGGKFEVRSVTTIWLGPRESRAMYYREEVIAAPNDIKQRYSSAVLNLY